MIMTRKLPLRRNSARARNREPASGLSITYTVPMPVRLPRVEAILGAPIDQLTIEDIQAAVDASVEESRDLDFKEDHYPKGNDGNDELAKDVAAFANHVGGLIVIGVREQQLRAVELTPVTLANDPGGRCEQILLRRITPFVRDVNIRVLESTDQPGQGIVLIAVPRSLAAPHAVFRERDDLHRMSWPVRSGTGTRYLDETEPADFYRTRFAGAAAQSARLETVQAEGRLRLGGADSQPVWLAISLVPALPGEVRPTDRVERARSLTQQWALQQPWEEQAIPSRLAQRPSVTVGVRRAILPRGRDWQSDRLHLELHDDGAGYGAVLCGGYDAAHVTIGVPLRQFALDSLWLTSLLAAHARDAGAGGEALLAAELLIHTTNRVVGIVDDDEFFRGTPVSGSFQVNSAVLPDMTRPAASNLSVDLSALAPGAQPVAKVAARLAGDLAAVFGVADLAVLSADGQLRPQSFPPNGGRALFEWAQQNGVLAAPSG
jgi:Putative DNA-binding domain